MRNTETILSRHVAELLVRQWSGSATEAEIADLADWRRGHPESERSVVSFLAMLSSGPGNQSIPTPSQVNAFVGRLGNAIREEKSSSASHSLSNGTPPLQTAERGHVFRRETLGRAIPTRRFVVMTAVVSAFVAVVVVVGGLGVLRGNGASVMVQDMTTAPGQRATVTLSDGTVIRLAPATRIRTTESFGTSAREVILHGEAYFEIASNPSRPFVVTTADAKATVLGTSFNVRRYASDSVTEVGVVDGRVSLGTTILSAGDVGIANQIGQVAATQRPVASIASWTRNRFDFERMPMKDVIVELERWYGVTIVLRQPEIGRLDLVATIDADSIDDAMRLIAMSLNLTYSIRGKLVELGRPEQER